MTSIHRPLVEVKLESGSVEVRELSWPDALHLFNRVKAQASGVLNGKGEIELGLDKLVGMISENIELASWLVLRTVSLKNGKLVDEAWLEQRSVSEVLELVTTSAELNLGIIIERVKKGQSRLRGLMPAMNPSEPRPGSSG